MLVEFTSVVAAVECAVAIQHGMAGWNEDRPPEEPADRAPYPSAFERIVEGLRKVGLPE